MRSIFGWDLPPGCSNKDIPGNSEAEWAWECIEENFYNQAIFTPAELKLAEQLDGNISSIVMKAIIGE
jgi:hypothetical protein